MTEVSPRRAGTPVATILAALSLVIVLALAGVYVWEHQSEQRDQNNAMIDQLRRIDARLSKLEDAAAAQDTHGIAENLAHLDARLTDFAHATDAVVGQSNDIKMLTGKLEQVLADQAKLHEEISALRMTNHEAHAAAQQLASRDMQTALSHELSDLAPVLLAPESHGNFWDAAWRQMQGWVSARPLPSATADTHTLAGKISRALSDIDRGDIQAALDILPKDEAQLMAFRTHAAEFINAQQQAAKAQDVVPLATPGPVETLTPPVLAPAPSSGTLLIPRGAASP